ncbi:MAG: histidine phosphatase family protein [Gammaproteobacteria bacterium]|nr:histidine phosphatase family protein [Gammaproteobacteria bacterium]
MRLWLIRHAKSSWSSAAGGDFDRPLNQRGERDGPKMRDWLADQAHPAQWIWTSDAARAAATAAFVAEAFPDAALKADHRLYGASPTTLVGVLRETPAAIATAAIVAHNPSITHCVNLLVASTVIDNMPTFGAVLLWWPGGPEALQAGAARLEALMSPKRLLGDLPPGHIPLD